MFIIPGVICRMNHLAAVSCNTVCMSQHKLLIQDRIIGGYCTAFTGSYSLYGMKAERGHICNAADRLSVILGTDGMCSIFDQNQIMLFTDGADFIQLHSLACKIYSNNCPGLLSDALSDRIRVNIISIRINIGKYRTRTAVKRAVGRSCECNGSRNHLVPFFDAGCHGGNVQGSSTVRNCHTIFCSGHFTQHFL